MLQIKQTTIATYATQDIIEYQLITNNGFIVKILNYGGIIQAIYTPDKNGKVANVVLCNQQFEPTNPNYMGAIIGRVAGRIAEGKFNLNDTNYQLSINNGVNNLHGGLNGLDKKIWTVTKLTDGIELRYFSPDLEEGFPANVEFKVKYRITGNYCLSIEYFASCNRPTIINLTNHSYFDLTIGQDPLRMELKIPAKYFALIDAQCCVTGTICSVNNTPFDFNKLKPIGQDINLANAQLQLAGGGYDHPYILNTNPIIQLVDPISQRYLNVTTTEPCCVIYSANHCLIKHSGLCIETQKIPNAINWQPYQTQVTYTPEKPYYSRSVWQFGVSASTS